MARLDAGTQRRWHWLESITTPAGDGCTGISSGRGPSLRLCFGRRLAVAAHRHSGAGALLGLRRGGRASACAPRGARVAHLAAEEFRLGEDEKVIEVHVRELSGG